MEFKTAILETREDLEKAQQLLDSGWEKREDVPYNTFEGKLIQLVKYTEEEKAEIEAEKERRTTRPQPSVDVNVLRVPILDYEEDKEGKENPYKKLAALGYHEVHRTSQVAIMKLDDPRGVMLSDEELELLIFALSGVDASDYLGYSDYDAEQPKILKLQNRLQEILEHSREAKKLEEANPPQEQTESNQ